MNDIPRLQNEEPQLQLLRARRQTYRSAENVMFLQVLLTLIVPVVGAIIAAFNEDLRAVVAAASLAAVILDVLLLDRIYKELTLRAAKIAEHFDCTVLSLPWNRFLVGDKVDIEDIHAAAKRFAKRRDDKKLRDWYPKVVGEQPLQLARILCQRANLRYDSKLRRSYAMLIKFFAISICIGLFAVGLYQNAVFAEWVLTMAPATPVIAWTAREYHRQRDTAGVLEKLLRDANQLWRSAVAKECSTEDCLVKSREFQNAIYNRRANSPLVMPFVYSVKRPDLEDEMKEGAEQLIRESSHQRS